MKAMIVTTPLRPIASSFPPIGSLNIISYARKHGFDDIEFYNIDEFRPDFDDVIEFIRRASPDVLGISAVVSTSYEYTKRLSLEVKKILPETLICISSDLI